MVTLNSPSTKWMAYLSDSVFDDPNLSASFLWGQQGGEQTVCSVDAGVAKEEMSDPEKEASGSKKRLREEFAKDSAGNKANREKMRRDRLNDRFIELSQAVEPDRPPKTDKATILCDAVRILGQLRAEAQQLKDGNQQLREQIKELKTEKNELRDEKARLKSEKERLELQVKAISMPAGYMPHPAAMQAAAAAFAAQAQVHAQAASVKAAAPVSYPSMAMWQWLPPASVDTSQDHILRPPVA